jgi:hypothetical protein
VSILFCNPSNHSFIHFSFIEQCTGSLCFLILALHGMAFLIAALWFTSCLEERGLDALLSFFQSQALSFGLEIISCFLFFSLCYCLQRHCYYSRCCACMCCCCGLDSPDWHSPAAQAREAQEDAEDEADDEVDENEEIGTGHLLAETPDGGIELDPTGHAPSE